MRPRRLVTVGLAAVLVGGCGSGGNPNFSVEANRACAGARLGANVLPDNTGPLVLHAASVVRGLKQPASGHALAAEFAAAMRRQGRAADRLAHELDAVEPNRARVARLRATVEREGREIEDQAAPLGIHGCGAIPAALVRDASSVETAEPPRMSRAAYGRALRGALGRLVGRTQAIQAAAARATLGAGDLAGYSKDVGRAADRLVRLTPPADAEDAHSVLVTGLRGLSAATARAASQLRAGRTARAVRSIQRFFASDTAKAVSAAAAVLQKRHYLR
jgi:hypothetical protein